MKKIALFLIFLAMCDFMVMAQKTTDRIKADIVKLEELKKKHDSYSDTVYSFISNKLSSSDLNDDERALWHCYMAKFLNNYLDRNLMKIVDRTALKDYADAELATWGTEKIVAEMIAHTMKSVENKEVLQKTDVKAYLTLMQKYDESSYTSEMIDSFLVYRPTLYDCLAQEAITLFSDDISELPVPMVPFDLDSSRFFVSNEEFAAMRITSPDTLSLQFQTLLLLQELTKFHLASGHSLALLDVTLQRIDYLQKNTSLENADNLILDILLKLENDYRGKDGYADVCYAIGKFYMNRDAGDEFDEANRYDFRTAADYFEKAIAFDPKTVAAENAQTALAELKKEFISVALPEMSLPKENIITYKYKNCNNIYVRILPLSESEFDNLQKNVGYDEKKLYQRLTQMKHLKEWKSEVGNPDDYRTHCADGILPALQAGEYTLIASAEEFSTEIPAGFSHLTFKVSNIDAMKRGLSYRDTPDVELLFYDLMTGAPIQKKQVEVEYMADHTRIEGKKRFTTDAKGIVSVPKRAGCYLMHVTMKDGNDIYSETIYYSNYYDNADKEQYSAYIYTDRAIYRPGQKIYYKGIVVASSERKNVAVSGENVLVSLLDANYQEVAKVELITNEFGSFNGSFDIPVGALTGTYTIKTNLGSKSVSVEEYKRPQFEVVINSPEEDYRLNESVRITGSVAAYSGYALADAEVSYRVVRKAKFPYFYWWSRPTVPQKEIAYGTVKTGEDGSFSFEFIAEEAKGLKKDNPIYHFDIQVDVTDINGETHSAMQTVMVAKQALKLEVDAPDVVDSENDNAKFPVSALNLGGVPQVVDISYKFELLEMPARFMHKRPNEKPDCLSSDSSKLKNVFPYLALNDENIYANWKIAEMVQQGSLKSDSGAAVLFSNLKSLKEGAYKLTLSATDKYGEKVIKEHYLFLQSPKNKRSSVFAALSVQPDKSTAKPGEVITVSIGSYLPTANVYLEVMSNDSLLYSEWIVLKRGQTQCEVPVTEGMRGEITIDGFVADNGFIYKETAVVDVPFSNMNIDFEWGTFRDKTQPGTEEEITLKLKGENGDKVAAELLCAMYDASLDVFSSNNFALSLDYLNLPFYMEPFTSYVNNSYYGSHYENLSQSFHNYSSKIYYRLKCDFLYERSFYRNLMYSKTNMHVVSDAADESVAVANGKMEMDEEGIYIEDKAAAKAETEEEQQVRTDFAETAFFYPDLRTDADGSVILKFKLPETLTKWKMLGLAHTADMKTGTFVKYIQTAKNLMVVPNMPRFMREGDTLMLSAKIVNTGKTDLSGTVTIDFYNTLDNKELNIVNGESALPFSVAAGASAEVGFKVIVPHDVPALTYRLAARSQKADGVSFSDGESATLPVLPNRMLVTETMNLYVNGNESKRFVFKALDNYLRGVAPETRKHFNLKLEMTPNPMWYAVQALPYLMQYPYDCNEQMFSKLYANSLAAHIANSSSDIKQAFEAWKDENPDELCSNLEKNEDLKYALLEETPWVIDAQNEATQKHSIGNLFDEEKIASENLQVIRKLEKNQNPNGSWSWFGSGYPSRFITQHIVAGSGHLAVLGIDELNNMLPEKCLRKAVKYMDGEISHSYNLLKAGKSDISKIQLLEFEIHSFYARSFFINKYPLSKNDREAYDFYFNQMKKKWSERSIYMQAMIALVMYRNGEKELAQTIIKELKKRALYSDELGMYWKTEGRGWFWYEAPVERQALLIEAFLTIANDVQSAEKMQLWLLKQKQTQNWGTTKGTTEACYALFLKNGLKLKEIKQQKPIQVSILDTVIMIEDNPATPTVMQSVPLKENVTVKNTAVTLTKSDDGSAWGGVYWQYFDELENIEATSKNVPLSMVKQLYRVELGPRGETLVPITPQKPIRVGDKVRVRVELRADRDFEYVHLKDMRAAAFEPADLFSGYRRQGNLYYYESVRDASVNFFFDFLRKGTYVFEYTLVATQAGTFSNGISTIQCMYAPQFSAHSKGLSVTIEK